MNLWLPRMLRPGALSLLGVLLLLAVAPARARQEGGIVRSTGDYVYGQTMRFHLSASDIGPVQAITLYFRLGASADSFAVAIDVPSGPVIDVSYALDLTQMRLPPFIAVTYWWALERDEDTLLVPEQIISYTDDQFNWSQLVETDEVGGGSVRVHWTGEGTAVGERARDLVFEMLPRLAPLLPVERVLPFDVYIYPSTADLGAALRLAGRGFQPGQTYPELGVVLATVVNPETADSELRPDLARGLVDLLLFQGLGQSAYRVPPWLTHGLAGAGPRRRGHRRRRCLARGHFIGHNPVRRRAMRRAGRRRRPGRGSERGAGTLHCHELRRRRRARTGGRLCRGR